MCVFVVVSNGQLVGGLALEHEALVRTLQQYQDVLQQQHLQLDQSVRTQPPHQRAVVDQFVLRQVQLLLMPKKGRHKPKTTLSHLVSHNSHATS